MPAPHDIELSTLLPDEIALAAGVAARGMRDNPFSVALFGDDPGRRVRGLKPTFQWVLSSLQRPSLVARRHGVIVGIAALSPPEHCFYRQTVARERTVQVGKRRMGVMVPQIPWRLLPSLLAVGPGALGRLSTLGEAGMRHDPPQRHHHVELVVVEAGQQGQGIGRLMMQELCRKLDQLPDMAYLETDKLENVRFYKRFGFEVTAEATVLQTPAWYMERRSAR
jgi:ribosomal protein S18 acetylase RimI-like enzyme